MDRPETGGEGRCCDDKDRPIVNQGFFAEGVRRESVALDSKSVPLIGLQEEAGQQQGDSGKSERPATTRTAETNGIEVCLDETCQLSMVMMGPGKQGSGKTERVGQSCEVR